MKRGLLVFFAICAFTIAMVPRDRRAVNTEEQEGSSIPKGKEVCARQTPCAWSVYQPVTKKIDINITNSYCICDVGMTCVNDEDDTSTSAYVYRCRAESEGKHAS